MSWIFCNKCSLKFHPNIKFLLMECGHIFCERCTVKMSTLGQCKQCGICNKSTSGAMVLSKDMDHATQMFFMPFENMLEQTIKVFNFQSMHKSLFVQSLSRKYNFAKKECINYYNANKKLQKENQMMREMLKSVGYNQPPFITSTPSKSPGKYDDNISLMSSIRGTPNSLPGSAQRIFYSNRKGPMFRRMMLQFDNYVIKELKTFVKPVIQEAPVSANSSCAQGPSPAQTVPKVYMAPVHREPNMEHPAAATPTYIDKFRSRSGYPSLGYPRK